jgi:ABC-2 type transport system permease protein
VFLSSLTENQLIAAVSSICVIAVFLALFFVVDKIGIEWMRVFLKWFSILDRYKPFTNELLDITSVVYFISLSAVFLFLTVRVYEKRRWS